MFNGYGTTTWVPFAKRGLPSGDCDRVADKTCQNPNALALCSSVADGAVDLACARMCGVTL